jgi:hypothetical protein
MKTEVREIYKCEHCNKLYQRKNACEYHEKICKKNPDNDRACFGCSNVQKITAKYVSEHSFGERAEDVEILYCKKIIRGIYPPIVEHKGGSHYDYITDYKGDEIENGPMLRACEHQEFDLLPF